jgi:hypothetical protein
MIHLIGLKLLFDQIINYKFNSNVKSISSSKRYFSNSKSTILYFNYLFFNVNSNKFSIPLRVRLGVRFKKNNLRF